MPKIDTDAIRAAEHVDADRLWRRHMEMAEIGAIANDGVNRQALSAEDVAARRLLLQWAAERQYTCAIDPIGNIFIRREGLDPTEPPVLAGSHMDSQPRGGRFDGIYGVLAGLEVLDALSDAGLETRRPVEAVAWTNEEGSRFAPGAMGSAVFTGERRLEDVMEIRDPDGTALKDALAETLAATPECTPRPFNFPIAACIEPHIEQGPVLESEDRAIGAVTGIQGIRWFEVDIRGDAAHAGTTPLGARRDAVQGAVRAIEALNRLTADPEDRLRFTVGRITVSPNSPNTVADHVHFTIDMRHADLAVLERLSAAMAETCARAADPCVAQLRETFRKDPAVFGEEIVETIGRAADALSLPMRRMPSGAFHDAGFLNDVCPAGMIFVPCRDGISHSEAEYASAEQLAAGARVLAATVFTLATR